VIPLPQPDEPPCECPGPGHCKRYNRNQTDYAWRVCSGNCTAEFPCSESKSQHYRKRWRRDLTPGAERPPVVPPTATPAATLTDHDRFAPLVARGLWRGVCAHRGEPTGETAGCAACGQRHLEEPVYHCGEGKHEKCVQNRAVKDRGITFCQKCPDFVPLGQARLEASARLHARERGPIAGPEAPSYLRRLDERSAWPGAPGLRFNSSILQVPGKPGYLFAYRTGWRGSEIYLGWLDETFAPTGQPWKLELYHAREAPYGREDVRLFWHAGRMHVGYVGVVARLNTLHHTSVLYARLTEDLTVEQVYYPAYDKRNDWEKNWQFFSHDGELFAVYRVAPHTILRIEGEKATLAYTTPTRAPWTGGELRGGASPVRVGEEYWCFFHDSVERNGRRVYRAGLYTFEARAPFRVQRMILRPILEADPTTRPADQWCSVVFPCGAMPLGGDE